MTELEQSFIDAIKTLANHKPLVEACEPNICWHEPIKDSQVLRVLSAYNLLKETTEKVRVV